MLKHSYQKLWRMLEWVWANRTTGVSVKGYHRIYKRMGRRKGGKNGNEKNHEEWKQDCSSKETRGQKESEEISAQQTHYFTLLRVLPHPLVPLYHHISQVFHHQHVAQPFPLYCPCFSNVFPSTTQQLVGKEIVTVFWQLLSLQNSSSLSELTDLSICMSLSRHTGPVAPQEVPCPRAD